MAANLNRWVGTGNLTRDPEMRSTGSGMSVCSLRIAVNGRRKNSDGDWVDKANYFDVTVFGNQAEAVARFLSKGKPVAIDGRLDWQEWEDKESGAKRQAVKIIADTVQFLGGRDDNASSGGGSDVTPSDAVPAASAAQGGGEFGTSSDDDIPFAVDGFPGYEERRGHASRW